MKYCSCCKVRLTGKLDVCPLCQAHLCGYATPAVFPDNTVKKSGIVALAVLGFTTGVCLLVMIFLGFLLTIPFNIVAPVCLALVLNYLLVRNILIHAPDFLRVIARYFLLLLVLAALWFAISGDKIISTFIIPGICLVALVFDAVLVIIFRGTFVGDYAKYLLFDVILGLTPLLLVAFHLCTWDVPALISALVACVLLLGLLVFTRRQLIAEVRKLFSA